MPVADAHLVVRRPVDGEILPEPAELQIVALEDLAPVRVGLRLVDEDGPLLPAVALKVTLAVTVEPPGAAQPRGEVGRLGMLLNDPADRGGEEAYKKVQK